MARSRHLLPGFGLTFGITIFLLSTIVLIPLSTTVFRASGMGWEEFWRVISSPQAVSAFKVSFATSFWAALVDMVGGVIVAWVLVRYPFPGRKFFDGIVDLPFALPTAVAGIALMALYSQNGLIGQYTHAWGIKTALSPLGIGIALAFIGLPFVVRSVQPILEDLEPEIEEASATLGAGRLKTIAKVVFPELWPAVLTGFTMAFARALGEFGSVVFISGNKPMETQILPLLIYQQLEQSNYNAAAAIGVAMLTLSFFFLLLINLLQRWTLKRRGQS